MTGLNLFGLFAVTVMVVCYALEQRHPAFVLAFAASCVLASVYGFLQGAWPFGIVEGIWSVVAVGTLVSPRPTACQRAFSSATRQFKTH